MKNIFSKAASFGLALLVLVSTMSFTVDKHFCGNFLVDLAVFSEAEKCGMEHAPGMSEAGGCKDQNISVEGQKNLKMSFFDLDLDQQVFLSTFTYSYAELFAELPQQVAPFTYYSPPLLVYDIHLLDETFLI